MRAITIPEFGDPDVLLPVDLADPVPGPGEISIDVAHAGANYAEVLYRKGAVDVPLPYVPGIEVSGRIRALGERVTGLRVGQLVAALTIIDGGGYAEIAVADAHLVAPLPDDVDDDTLARVAGVPSNSTTATLVMAVAHLTEGETVLIHGAAGGVGSQLGQVAKRLGAARVIGTVGRPEKIDKAAAFGYDTVVLRDDLADRAEFLTDGRGFEVIIDPVGGPIRRTSIGLLSGGGRLVAMGNASGADPIHVDTNDLWFAGTAVLGFNLAALANTHAERVGDALRTAITDVLGDRLHVPITERLPLTDASQVHRQIESGKTIGKLILDV